MTSYKFYVEVIIDEDNPGSAQAFVTSDGGDVGNCSVGVRVIEGQCELGSLILCEVSNCEVERC